MSNRKELLEEAKRTYIWKKRQQEAKWLLTGLNEDEDETKERENKEKEEKEKKEKKEKEEGRKKKRKMKPLSASMQRMNEMINSVINRITSLKRGAKVVHHLPVLILYLSFTSPTTAVRVVSIKALFFQTVSKFRLWQ